MNLWKHDNVTLPSQTKAFYTRALAKIDNFLNKIINTFLPRWLLTILIRAFGPSVHHQGMKQMLFRPKDPIPKEKKTGVIYKIPCQDCNTNYIGETGRALSTRIKEHQGLRPPGQIWEISNSRTCKQPWPWNILARRRNLGHAKQLA